MSNRRVMLPTAAGLLGTLALAACTDDTPRRVIARPVFSLETAGRGELVDLLEELAGVAWRGEPLEGAAERPLVCLEVLDIDELIVEGDRGTEHVRIHGLGGVDERLPEFINHYIRQEARPALQDWLGEAGTSLAEVMLGAFQAGGPSAGPFLGIDGLRPITLVRVGPDGERIDVRTHALLQGWTYPLNPYTDGLALDGRLQHDAAESELGLYALEEMRALRLELKQDGERVAAWPEREFQRRGEALHGEVAAWLGWTPDTRLHFHAATVEEALVPISLDQERRLADIKEALFLQVTKDAPPTVTRDDFEFEVEAAPTEERAREVIEAFEAYSPAGADIWWFRKGGIPEGLVEAVLVHEIVHQYQEERTLPGCFPPIDAPPDLVEAHAEWIAGRWIRERWPGAREHLAIDYVDRTKQFTVAARALELGGDDLIRRILAEPSARDDWGSVANYEMGVQEWLFLHASQSEYDGVDFAPAEVEDGVPVVLVRNLSAEPFVAQFHGLWIWSFENDLESGSITLSGPPFNLSLPPLGSVRIRLANEPHWNEHSPLGMTGLFSRSTPPR